MAEGVPGWVGLAGHCLFPTIVTIRLRQAPIHILTFIGFQHKHLENDMGVRTLTRRSVFQPPLVENVLWDGSKNHDIFASCSFSFLKLMCQRPHFKAGCVPVCRLLPRHRKEKERTTFVGTREKPSPLLIEGGSWMCFRCLTERTTTAPCN